MSTKFEHGDAIIEESINLSKLSISYLNSLVVHEIRVYRVMSTPNLQQLFQSKVDVKIELSNREVNPPTSSMVEEVEDKIEITAMVMVDIVKVVVQIIMIVEGNATKEVKSK